MLPVLTVKIVIYGTGAPIALLNFIHHQVSGEPIQVYERKDSAARSFTFKPKGLGPVEGHEVAVQLVARDRLLPRGQHR